MHLYFAHSYWTSICYPYFDPSILCHAVLSVTFTLRQLLGQYSVTFSLMPVFSVIQGSSLVTRTNTPGRFLRNTWVLWTTRYWPESHFDNSEHSIASVQNSRLDEFLLVWTTFEYQIGQILTWTHNLCPNWRCPTGEILQCRAEITDYIDHN